MAYRKIRENIEKIECDAMVEFFGFCPGILDLPKVFDICTLPTRPTIEKLISVTRLDYGKYLLRVPLPFEDLWKNMEVLYPALTEKAEKLGCKSMAVPLLADWESINTGKANNFNFEKDIYWLLQAAEYWLRHTELFVYVVIPPEMPNLHSYSFEARELDRRIEALQRSKDVESAPRPCNAFFYEPDYPPFADYIEDFELEAPMLEAPMGDGARGPDREGLCKGENSKKIKKESSVDPELESRIKKPGESFRDMLFRLIDERGLTDAQCYNRAGISRQVFAKIRSNPQYQPKKATAVCFAIALELDLNQTNSLLKTAGYSFSPFNEFDIIVEYYIEHEKYDFFDINESLYAYGQELLAV